MTKNNGPELASKNSKPVSLNPLIWICLADLLLLDDGLAYFTAAIYMTGLYNGK